jgi:hypothetical protein
MVEASDAANQTTFRLALLYMHGPLPFKRHKQLYGAAMHASHQEKVG